MLPLAERYRPKDWSEVVGQDKVVKRLQALGARSGFAGRAYWLTGQSGTGKTTIARIIAAQVASEWATIEMDADSLDVATLERLLNKIDGPCLGQGGWALVINEAHGLRAPIIRRLLVALEAIPRYAVWCFTTTSDGQADLFGSQLDANPLLSRCLRFDLARRDLKKPFAARMWRVMVDSGLGEQPIEKCERWLSDNNNNLRAGLQFVEAGGMLD